MVFFVLIQWDFVEKEMICGQKKVYYLPTLDIIFNFGELKIGLGDIFPDKYCLP